jgi:GDPmannose 4,6-dehydratase
MGNMDALRDWGHAKDYVRMQWMMLQQDQPKDYVIATGAQYSVRQFIEKSAAQLGITLRFEGQGISEYAVVVAISGDKALSLKLGDVVVRVDPNYFRPAEVETLLGDPSLAKKDLGWIPQITLDEMVQEMMASDLEQARQHALLKLHGYSVQASKEK